MDTFKQISNVKRNKRHYLIYIASTIAICLFPIYGKLLDRDYQLNGIASSAGSVPTGFYSVWSGKTTSAIETKLKEIIPGRTTLIRFHSQYMYSLFNSSSNTNVVIGDKHSLFEPEYLCDFLNLWPVMTDDAQDDLISKLSLLESLLNSKGKKLYIFVTPSKVRYDYANIPWVYRMLSKPTMRTNYDGFIKKLDASGIKYFDSIQYINENMNDETVFYSSGIHWGNGASAQVTTALLEDLKTDTGYDLGELSVSLVDSQTGIWPDQDLLSTLNLYSYSKEDSYRIPEFNYSAGIDHPNVLIRGGSFMGQTLSKLIDMDAFGNSVYLQNNLLIENKSDIRTLSDFDAYEEIDTSRMADIADLVILEVNEEKIWIMGWGFIDELITALQNGSEAGDIQLVGQVDLSTDINPWGTNIGYISYGDEEGVIITTPENAMIKLSAEEKHGFLSFDAEIHEWVREYSDGCNLVVETTGEQTDINEFTIPGGSEDNQPVHVIVPVDNISQVQIYYYTPDGSTADCDWVVIRNIKIE